MARIALVNIDMHGHVYPTLGPTRELIRRGHEVFFFGSSNFESKVVSTGAVFRSYDTSIGATTALYAKAQAEATARGVAPPREVSALGRFRTEFENTFGQLFQGLSLIRPDVIVHTFATLAPKVIADHFGIPSVKFMTTYASNKHFNLMRETFAKHDFPSLDEMQGTQSMLNRVTGQYGCAAPDLVATFDAIDDHNLVFMPRSFQPHGDTFDERFQFVGPCIREGQSTEAWSLIPEGPGPVMIIALGSLFHEWPEFYRATFEAFGGSPWRIVMAIGSKLRAEDLGKIPKNFRILPHIPQVELLPHADLFVSHGGMNSTMESLFFGVPLVVIPQIEEQEVTARRVKAMGLGHYLSREELDAKTLGAAVNSVYRNSGILRRVHVVKDDIHASGGSARAATVIEEVIGAQIAPFRRSTSQTKEVL